MDAATELSVEKFPPLSLCGIPNGCLCVIAANAALTTRSNGGFMPHARHGGSGVRAFAVAGSKLDGTGLEKEHIGQTHVALVAGVGAGDGASDRRGLPCLSGVVDTVV